MVVVTVQGAPPPHHLQSIPEQSHLRNCVLRVPVVGIHFWPNWNNAILYFLREHFGRDNRNLATVVTTLSAIQYGR